MEKKPLSEYPRPQFKRDSYISLNGEWEYEISQNSELPTCFNDKILVPFSIESEINGAKHILQPDEYLFYKLEFQLPKDFIKEEVYLNFLAVDQICDVYLNDKFIGHHEGGYLPFKFEIKEHLKDNNILIVKVKDYTDTSYYSRGKQKLDNGGIWYTPQSGIYFPVFLESVPFEHVENIKLTPDIDKQELIINVSSRAKKCVVTIENYEIEINTNENVHLPIKQIHLWCIEDPYLYPLIIEIGQDRVESYFAMRKFSIAVDEDGHKRFALNNKPIFLKGVLDQGYYKRGLYTPEKYEDYINDIELVKSLGFNTIRKHIKIEIPRWYYECDKRGIIVMQDFVNGGHEYDFLTITTPLFTHMHSNDHKYKKFHREDEQERRIAIEEFKDTINYLYNSPCIALWTIFNEGWGQFDAKMVLEEMLKIDSTRLYDHASGWHDQKVGDIKSMHFYFQPAIMPKRDSRCLFISEFGGLVYKEEGHVMNGNAVYRQFKTKDKFLKAYEKMIKRDILKNIPKGLTGSIYTQLSDVEEEANGFITFDREVIKFDKEEIKRINELIHL